MRSYETGWEGNKFLKNNFEVSKELNNFFEEALPTLDINKHTYIINLASKNMWDPITKAVSKKKFHLRLLPINDQVANQEKFFFKPISVFYLGKSSIYFNKVTTIDTFLLIILRLSSAASADVLNNPFYNTSNQLHE